MSYKALIDSNLNKAFNAAKDLADTVIFVRKSGPTFNFGTVALETQTSQNITTKAIIYNSKKRSKERNLMIKEIMFKTKEIGDANLYDSVTIGSASWNITSIIKNDGYVSVLELSKEL